MEEIKKKKGKSGKETVKIGFNQIMQLGAANQKPNKEIEVNKEVDEKKDIKEH